MPPLFPGELSLPQPLRDVMERTTLAGVLGAASACLLGKILWQQYGILRHRSLPERELGLPVLGQTLNMFRMSLEILGDKLMKGKQAVLTNFLFSNVVIVDYRLYLQTVQRAELDGEIQPGWMPAMKELLGKNSIILLPGGKGHPLHKRLRAKILASLGSKNVLDMQPEILQLIRSTLDALAEETAAKGFATFAPAAGDIASRASVMMITAGLDPETQEKMPALLDAAFAGILAIPLDLGPLTLFGRAKRARREIGNIIKCVMENPNLYRRNIIADLMKSNEDGEGFTLDEIVDTTFTLLVAGRLTTAEALPVLFARLHEHRDWAAKVAQEEVELAGVEKDCATLRVVRESLRIKPPAGAFRRECIDPRGSMDLGEYGHVPPGCPIAVSIRNPLVGMGPEFNPDRWTPEVAREQFIVFGGSQPHNCVGKALALLELQLFARVLCREYDFEALDTTLVVNPKLPIDVCYKDGLRVRITRKKGLS